MILYNKTQGSTLCTDLKEATSLKDKSLGLLDKKNPRSLLFKTRFGIHTFFLKAPIDILILDAQNTVAVAKTIKPNRFFLYNPIHSTAIELQQGTISKSKTRAGDILKISPN